MSAFTEQKPAPSIDHEVPLQTSTDWFETIDSTHQRLYAPGLRTELSAKAWEAFPAFLENNADLLKEMMGSSEISVHIHGSTALGIAGPRTLEDEEAEHKIHGSDIDFLILVGEKDHHEQDYQEKFSKKDADLPSGRREDERGWRFLEKSGFQERLGLRGDFTIIHIPELQAKIKDLDASLDKNEWPEHAFHTLIDTGLILASPCVFESQEGEKTAFRNAIVASILESRHSRIVWDQVTRLFREYTIEYEKGAWFGSEKSHHTRVEQAFAEILQKRGILPERHEKAKSFMRKQRDDINLPTYDQITSLKPQLGIN